VGAGGVSAENAGRKEEKRRYVAERVEGDVEN